MNPPEPSAKQKLRRRLMAARAAMSAGQRAEYSARIHQRLRALLQSRFARQHTLLCYLALPAEVETRPILAWPGYRFFAPRVHRHTQMHWLRVDATTRWQRSRWGVEEPIQGNAWRAEDGGILLCPLTGFDRTGNRLGMGKGCFDLWLSSHAHALQAIVGLAFSCQEADSIPVEPHDVPMHFVLTEKECIACLN
ncbi:MAG: 5-formyltetrahydrofolate cyclo-ligase [Zetaproteobacteria bacterium]|nr:MAG: 5-formyltetrahydrofolate cyclo-ligase [Zetaproteobacteria bacterium]